MYQIKNEQEYLVRAIELGALGESTPLESLHICKTVLLLTNIDQKISEKCKIKLTEMKSQFSNSKIFLEELEK